MESSVEPVYKELKDTFLAFKKTLQSGKLPDESQGDAGDTIDDVDPSELCFTQLFAKIDELTSKLDKDSGELVQLLVMKASLFYEQAKQYLTMNQANAAQALLESTLKLIDNYTSDPKMTFLYLRCVNHLSYIYSRSGELVKGQYLLESVINSEPSPETEVYSTEDLFLGVKLPKAEATLKLHKLVVNNMQMLGWLYGKLGLTEEHTKIQHISLQKQIDFGDTDPILWATRCSRLACLFLTQNKWVHARYHLTAAEIVLARLEYQLATNAELNRAQTELARTWIHYGLHLFNISKKVLLEEIYVNEGVAPLINCTAPVEDLLPDFFEFKGLTFSAPPVPAAQIVTNAQARSLFIHTHKWLKRSRLYYTLRDHPLQYVNSVLDLSELYRFLAFYEPDLDSQYNVQKKRYDSLEALCTILKEVRPSCYFAVSVELLKELADVQIELMGLNLKRLQAVEAVDMTEQNLNQRMNAVADVQDKLCTLEELLGSGKGDIPDDTADAFQCSLMESNKDCLIDQSDAL